MKAFKNRVLCQKWEESERGWGTRPDGYSLHLNEDDRKKYIEKYWAEMPNEILDEYSRPDGTPYWCEVSDKTFEKVRVGKNGLRFFGRPPSRGGTDGWVPFGPEV